MITRYDSSRDLIVVEATVWGPRQRRTLQLILDTGCAECTITPRIAEELGYGSEDSIRRTSVTTALGREHGYLIRVRAFDALGLALENFPVNVFDLAAAENLHGLIGLRFLNELNYEIRARDGVILAERADTGPLSAGP